MRRLFVLLLLLCVGPAWAEGPRFTITTPGVSPCNVTWQEPDSFNLYTAPVKGSPETKVGNLPNAFESSPPKEYSWPCPSAPGQYYFSHTAVTAAGEGTHSPSISFVIIDPTVPVMVQSIVPFSGKQGDTVAVTVSGSGFVNSGAQGFALPQSSVGISNVVVASDTSLTATLAIPIAEPVGTKLVTVGTAPGPNGTLASGFTVLANVIPLPGDFKIGATVKTKTLLNVRATPGGTIVAVQTAGAAGVLLEGPTDAAGATWWKVQYKVGVTGWSSQTYLTVVP